MKVPGPGVPNLLFSHTSNLNTITIHGQKEVADIRSAETLE